MSHATGLRIAIGQLQMHWTLQANTLGIVEAIELAGACGARLCVFPELALTGFHRQIVALATPDQVQPCLQQVRAACARHAVAASLGAPRFRDDGLICNSQLFIDAAGECVAAVDKIGLTPAEAIFFAPGTDRPVFDFCGLRCSAVLCREVEDLAQVGAQWPAGAVQLAVWPGLMSPNFDEPGLDPYAHIAQARQLATATQACIVQSNWPNSLNYPDKSAFAGQSVVIDEQGCERIRLPVARSGIGVFELGASAFEWHDRGVG